MRPIFALFLSFLASAFSGAAGAQVSDNLVRIGVLGDLSGVYADFGGPGDVVAARMAVEDFGGKVLGTLKVLRPGSRMETREILLKSGRVDVAFERIEGGKNRVTTSTWDDAKVILAKQVLEVAIIGKQVGLVRVHKPVAHLDIRDTLENV